MHTSNDLPTADPFSNPPPFPPDLPTDGIHQVQLQKLQKFQFHGTGLEYFGIWIVNILLIIITIGLYSPWAKVRRLRYFYGNTEFVRRRFDFTGVPTKILVGRLIALGLYFTISVVSNMSTEAMLIGALILYLAVPWLIRATLRFNARNSKFGNARFYFNGSNKHAYWVFFKSCLLMFLTLGLAFPIVMLWYKRYCFDHLYAGQLKFRFTASWFDFLKAMYLPVIIFALGFVTLWVMLIGGSLKPNAMLDSSIFSSMIGLLVMIYFLAFLVIWPWIQARVFISTWNNVVISRSKFQTDCNQWVFVWIVLTNLILKIVSLGLLTPWAAIRLYRYKVESLSLYLTNDPNGMINQLQRDHSAIAEEISDVFDLDISL